jgi:hypothetical protein
MILNLYCKQNVILSGVRRKAAHGVEEPRGCSCCDGPGKAFSQYGARGKLDKAG